MTSIPSMPPPAYPPVSYRDRSHARPRSLRAPGAALLVFGIVWAVARLASVPSGWTTALAVCAAAGVTLVVTGALAVWVGLRPGRRRTAVHICAVLAATVLGCTEALAYLVLFFAGVLMGWGVADGAPTPPGYMTELAIAALGCVAALPCFTAIGFLIWRARR